MSRARVPVRWLLTCLAVSAGLAACASEPGPGDAGGPRVLDPFELEIRAGRLEVFQDLVETIAWDLGLAGAQEPERSFIETRPERETVSNVHTSLVRTLDRFALLQSGLCAKGRFSLEGCQPPSLAWAERPLPRDVSLQKLDDWLNEAYETTMPLYGEVCDLGVATWGEPLLCSVE